jgi:hypothetical protein
MNDDHDSVVSESTVCGANVEGTSIEENAYEEISEIPLLSENEAKEMYKNTISSEETLPVVTDVLVKNKQDSITTYPRQLPSSDGSSVAYISCVYLYDTNVISV